MIDNNKILIVDDDESIRWVLDKGLKKKGYQVDLAKNGREGINKIEKQNDYFIVFLDIFMPDMNGLDVLQKIKKVQPGLFVIIMTAQGTMKNTIEAMQKGAYDYITKPFDLEEIYIFLEKVSKEIEQRKRINILESELKERIEIGEIVGKSKAMQRIFKIIGKAASLDVNVLIQGESGTGKELVARALHHNSHRVTEPFITVNCAAIPKDLLESELFGHEKGAFTGAVDQKKGKFELANNGTLFLDEIGDMDLRLQAKILRVLQDKEFYRVGAKSSLKSGARIIAATNRNLEEAVENKQFREDLYHRLNVILIMIPPLREHKEDIPLLAKHFVEKVEQESNHGKIYISPEVLKLLQHYEWSGNIRELENTIKRAVILSSGGTIQPEHLHSHLSKKLLDSELEGISPVVQFQKELYNLFKNVTDWENGRIYEDAIQSVEKALFQNILEKNGWNQSQAASVLGINRNTLRRKIEEHKLKKDASKENS
ncbi:MAG TPA: sigma-54 dependent transcriptional regulator [Nitrospinota bacterium]|nr:sigma-54 dependent transcriptional regulator [Nitrospinota bacterium]